jgi:hypothetical protein
LAQAARNVAPVIYGDTADAAFAVHREVSDRVCDRLDAGTEEVPAMVVSALILAEIDEVSGRDARGSHRVPAKTRAGSPSTRSGSAWQATSSGPSRPETSTSLLRRDP